MEKCDIPIPKQYLYLSDYSDLLEKLPQSGKYIINKVRKTKRKDDQEIRREFYQIL